jgi:DnaK suppressor protein
MDSIVAALEDKRAELEAELAQMSASPSESGGISFGKRVGEGTSVAVERLAQVAAHEQLQAVLADVHRALAKLDGGSYGECDRCSASIPSERLEILPWAGLCVRCASQR